MEFKNKLVMNTTKIIAFCIDAVEKLWYARGSYKIKAKGIAPLTNPDATSIWYS
jgi:hypothetical protein